MAKVAERLSVLKMTTAERNTYFNYLKEAVHSQDVLVAAELKGEEKGIAKGEARGLKKGEAIGLAKGKAEGEAIGLAKVEEKVLESRKQTAIKLLKRKTLSDVEICEDLGLSPNELAKLKQQHKR
jgi:flagellar biosynthesis/type III secretory pathway protein FliH